MLGGSDERDDPPAPAFDSRQCVPSPRLVGKALVHSARPITAPWQLSTPIDWGDAQAAGSFYGLRA
jgi:hypothetical protein